MDAQIIARWQFGITTVYHFLFVPLTISLSMLVAVLQTIWYKTGNDNYLRLTKFFGKLFLINFAAGVVTGIVQEFQFGMNWSEYSRFVGDVFGAPLALEALLAFFLESTFIGLWIFGWDRLPKKLHLMAIYLAAIGTMLSAIFILAANSWMQNPVGAVFRNGRAELTDFGALLTNPVFLATFPHQISASYMVGGGLVAGLSGWHLARLHKARLHAVAGEDLHYTGTTVKAEHVERDITTWRWAAKFGALVLLGASLAVVGSGDLQGKVMTEVQPMKMAAAEAHYETSDSPDLSIFTLGSLDGTKEVWSLKVPKLLSFLAHGNFDSQVQGINDLEAQYKDKGFIRDDGSQTELQKQYAQVLKTLPVDARPNVALSYWTFRIMMGLGFAGMAISAWILWALRKGRNPMPGRVWMIAMGTLPFLPVFANSFGWIFTEMGRQPWIVAGVLPTWTAASPSVSAGEAITTMVLFTLVYGVLAVIEMGLILKWNRAGLPEVAPVEMVEDEDAPLSFAY
ncbi:MAG: cytochrome ubiquinol oxidase subunit I [Luteococcus sp.]|uniref:cytochrome ubiquinol oxidase subunit I n=1 Tax=Luteococcus sp. TaxID=1969402 RepID=UPI002649D6BA|nr:cytochrome ubiquinol oxidase subunit I [Luteococcus sp.]MDN5563100.1 cytochrome ubiquinol oxidase subunit I [Luteococcus sp.]